MLQFIAVIGLALLWAKGGLLLYAVSGWLVVPYLGLGLIAGWFLQTEEERDNTREFWSRWL